MALDLKRQVLGAFLTFSMFAMLVNMVKREHFEMNLFETVHFDVRDVRKDEEKDFSMPTGVVSSALQKMDGRELKPCWNRPVSKDTEPPKGFITFSLLHGPEYHISQVTNAVVIARCLGATLVIPDIRGSKLGEKWNFHEIYDVEQFVNSLNGAVKIARELPTEIETRMLEVLRVPDRVRDDYIMRFIEPIYDQRTI